MTIFLRANLRQACGEGHIRLHQIVPLVKGLSFRFRKIFMSGHIQTITLPGRKLGYRFINLRPSAPGYGITLVAELVEVLERWSAEGQEPDVADGAPRVGNLHHVHLCN